MENKYIQKLKKIKQKHERFVAKQIREYYDLFINETNYFNTQRPDNVKTLILLEKDFFAWLYKNNHIRINYNPPYNKTYTFLNIELIKGDSFFVPFAWTSNDDLFSGNKDACIPIDIHNHSIFTCKEFPELIKYGLFDPTQYITIDVEEMGKENDIVYKSKNKCLLFTYGSSFFIDLDFDKIKHLNKKEITELINYKLSQK